MWCCIVKSPFVLNRHMCVFLNRHTSIWGLAQPPCKGYRKALLYLACWPQAQCLATFLHPPVFPVLPRALWKHRFTVRATFSKLLMLMIFGWQFMYAWWLQAQCLATLCRQFCLATSGFLETYVYSLPPFHSQQCIIVWLANYACLLHTQISVRHPFCTQLYSLCCH